MKFYKKKKFWIPAVLVIIIGGYFIFRDKTPAITYTTATAEKITLKQTVSSTGDLTDSREIILNFEIGGRIGGIFVREGQEVAAGDKIAIIDNPTLSAQVSQAKANLDGVVAKSSGTNDAIREAEVSVENAKDALDDTKDLNDKSVSAAKQAKSDAQDYLNDVQDYYDRILLDNGGDATLAAVRAVKLSLTAAQKAYNAASDALEITEKQTDLSKTNAENIVSSAKSRLKTLESDYTQNSNNAAVLAARASYDIAVENMSKATLISPVNGTVTRINNKVGEILGTGVIKESFTKVLANDFIIESNIPESDIVKVSLGDKAEVTFDALNTEDFFEAEIVQIDSDATVIQDVVYYRVKIRLSSVDPKLRPGMSANIDIATAQKDDVISIPQRGVKSEGEKKYVEILKDENIIERVYIETGLEGDEGMVEITKGLEGGENVVTFTQEK